MLEVAPLQPLHYPPQLLADLVAPPYDVIDSELRRRLGSKHPNNVVHVDLPEGEGDAKYARARELFLKWQAEGVLVRDETPAFWRYAQTFQPPGGGTPITRRGFFGLVRCVPFSERIVLPHERTLKGPKLDRQMLSRATQATLSPQFLLYADPSRGLDSFLDQGQFLAEFETEDGILHQLSRVTDPEAIGAITRTLAAGQALIADGHHRYETAVALSHEIEEQALARGIAGTEWGEHRFTMAFLANGDDPSLVVFPTHRLVHSLPTFDWDQLISRASQVFEVKPLEGGADVLRQQLRQVEGPAVVAMASLGRAALLRLRPDVVLAEHPVLGKRPRVLQRTDVVLLHDVLLEDILGITPEAQAQKTNLRYLQDPTRVQHALEAGEGQVGFLMNGTPVATVREVAQAGEVMPQKSTFFYPKVPTGICFHTLFADRKISIAPRLA